MIGKEPLDDIVDFEINGIKCGYDGVFVWNINSEGDEEFIGSFEDIKLIEETSHCAIFYSDCMGEYLSFDGKTFGGINKISFEIIPAHHEDDMPQLSEMWEQVRVIIDDEDIINKIGMDDDFHWGIESSCFLAQKDDYYGGKLLIGICGCTAEGDDDIVVDIDKSDNYISWKVYHDRNHEKNAIFVFGLDDYKKAITEAKNRMTKKEEDICDWLFLLQYSKNELANKIKNNLCGV